MALILTVIGRRTGTLWDVPIRVLERPSALVSHLLLVQNVFGTGLINYVLWSIAVEWQIYFLFPALVYLWSRLGPTTTVGGALLLGFGLRFAGEGGRLARAHPQFIGMFALGMLAAYVARSPQPVFVRARAARGWPWGALSCGALVVALVARWGIDLSIARFHFLDLPVGLWASCLLVLSSRAPHNPAQRLFSWRPLAALGTFSYSFYLIHAPLLQVLWQYLLHPTRLGHPAVFGVLVTAGLVVTIAASYVFFRVLEAPFMKQRATGA
jgi:peptidoglycan/LPS O-acetylase OafA/YrhL